MRHERSGLQTLCARADCEYDRGRGLEGDEGAGRTRGACTEVLAEFLISGMGVSCGGSKTVTKPNRGS